MRRALFGELVMGRIGIQNIRSIRETEMMLTGEDLSHPLDRFTVQDPSVRRMFEAKLVEAWRKFFEAAPKDPTDFKGINKALAALDAKISADNSLENKLNQILFPVFSQAGNAALKIQGQQRMNLLAVKLLRLRPTGLPTSLKAFGTLAIDPMTEKQMGYDRKGNGFKLWIAGQDGIDNGGVAYIPSTGMSRTGTDIVLGFDIGLPPPIVRAVKKAGSAPAGMPNPSFGGLE